MCILSKEYGKASYGNVKKDFDQIISEPFWHIEIETLPYPKDDYEGTYTTTFLHGMYYPEKIYLHILIILRINMAMIYITQNIKIARMVYQLIPIRKAEVNTTKFGVSKTAHFQSKMWYMLMLVSLDKSYQVLFEEIMNK